MVDYSKWDNMNLSDDEDERDTRKPVVTKLEHASRVTIGPQKGDIMVEEAVLQRIGHASNGKAKVMVAKPSGGRLNYNKWDDLVKDVEDETEEERFAREDYEAENEEIIEMQKQQAAERERTQRSIPASSTTSVSSSSSSLSATKAGGGKEKIVEDGESAWTRNGGKGNTDKSVEYFWSQSASDVRVCICVLPLTRGRDIKLLLGNGDLEDFTLNVEYQGTEYLNETLPYAIDTSEDYEEGDADWEVLDVCGKRVIVLTFPKKTAPLGGTFWWNRVFAGAKQEDIIDTAQDIQDRKVHKKAGEQTKFVDVWKQAEDEFKKRAAAREPQEIDI